MENDARVTVRLPQSVVEQATAEAAEVSRPLSWVVRKALEEHFERREGEEVLSEGAAATD